MSMIHEITEGAEKNRRGHRKGRGEGSGSGKTAGRGTKGAKARVGKYVKRGHEHGQTPIYRRLPKRGFSNDNFERRFHIVNLSDLERFDNGATVDATALKEAGLVSDLKQPVKILGDGAITKKLTVVAGWYSRSALEKITQAGGTVQDAKGQPFEFPKPKKVFVKREVPKESKKSKKQQAAEAEAAAAAPVEASSAEAPKAEGEKSE